MKILVVEDEVRVSSFIKKGLQEQGHEIVQAFDGHTGLQLACQHSFDVILLDVVMPMLNGIEVCDRLKNHFQVTTPILMLTALGTTDDIVLGLETGADDYLTKPFKFRELLARINALYRRKKALQNQKNQATWQVKDLVLNDTTKEVTRANKPIKLTAREYKLLLYLLKNKNSVVSRTQILEHVWEVDFDLGTNVIDVYINYLRKKINHGFEVKLIETVVGMGYTLKEE